QVFHFGAHALTFRLVATRGVFVQDDEEVEDAAAGQALQCGVGGKREDASRADVVSRAGEKAGDGGKKPLKVATTQGGAAQAVSERLRRDAPGLVRREVLQGGDVCRDLFAGEHVPVVRTQSPEVRFHGGGRNGFRFKQPVFFVGRGEHGKKLGMRNPE